MPLLTDLSKLFNDLNLIVPTSNFAMLPLDSYHATLSDIKCRCHFNTAQQYNEFLEQIIPNLKNLQYQLNSTKCEKVHYIYDSSVWNENNLSAMIAYLNVADEKSKLLMQQFDVMGKGMIGNAFNIVRPHLTLGYKIPNSNVENLSLEQKRMIVDVLNRRLKGKILTFGPPQVCTFSDMCKFTPIFP